MRVYTVHQNPDPLAEDQIEFVKEGFSWPALLFSLFWLLYHRMWLVAGGYLAISIAIEGLGAVLGGGFELEFLFATTALGLVFAAEANDLRRWSLHRRGWTYVGVVSGRRRDEAERRFFGVYELSASGALLPRAGVLA
jgi:hypothetical protein